MNKNELITQHANRTWQSVYACLDFYGIRHGVDYTGINVNNSVMLLSYSLNMINTSKWRKLSGLSTEVTQAAQLQNGDRARISFSGLDYRIEIPKPRGLHNIVGIGEVFGESRGLNVSFGVSAYDNTPNNIDFSNKTAGHILVSGSTRCGKTNILKIIAMSLIYKNDPDKMRIAIIDTVKSKGTYGALTNSTHLATDILNTEKKAVAFLRWVKDTIIKLEGRPFDKKIIIIIDEVYLLLKNKEAKDLLSYIASAGAGAGFHLIAATQYTRADEIGGRQFKGNLMTKVCGRVDDHYSSKNATGRDGAGAEGLMVPGDFLVVNEDGVTRVAVPEFHDRYLKKINRGISPIMTLNWEDQNPELPAVAPPKAPNIAACFDKIDHRLLHLALTGKNKRTNQPYGADVIRKASIVLAKRGLGESIGQNTANEYVKFARSMRGVK